MSSKTPDFSSDLDYLPLWTHVTGATFVSYRYEEASAVNQQKIIHQHWSDSSVKKLTNAARAQNTFSGPDSSFPCQVIQVPPLRRGTRLPLIVYAPETLKEKNFENKQIRPENIFMMKLSCHDWCGISDQEKPTCFCIVLCESWLWLLPLIFSFLHSISTREIEKVVCPSRCPVWRKQLLSRKR